ncbi:M17 family metallopeptidase [Mollicutes bacterium LVI A0078]|nr:M17 family metallopeptidase [Mollicutes bacterium LVI A0075]WOO90092.1 M17 family metallopeptidase [Mollicutes bacterium LVI A0078]
MFSISKFEFTQDTFNHKLLIEVKEDVKSEVKTFVSFENQDQKLIHCLVDKDSSNEQLLKLGETLSNEIEEDFIVEITDEFNIGLKYIIESVLIGLTPTNYYSRDYKLPKTFRVNGSYEFETAYIDAYNAALSYNVTRKLNHLPHADCNPDTMISFTENLFTMPEVNVTILRKSECESLSLNGMLALSQASRFEPTVIKIEYKTDSSLPAVALVGKGVMFDTGGYSIKTGRDISNMKADMGGAAAIFGTMYNLALTNQKANVTAYLMLTDNMINNEAIIPGDVITYSNGLSVEVANTDAEGRLILADGILLAKAEGAEQIIDLATLTGNAVAALGYEYAALYSNNQGLADVMLSVNKLSNDKVWQMPLVQEYKPTLAGNISDLRNISSSPYAGSITAALFLEAFVEDTNWMHIDMAAQTERSEFGTKYSGYGVRLLSNYINLTK